MGEGVHRVWYTSDMNVPLKAELEKFVQDQVRAGRFSSAGEVIEAGLARLMLDPPDEGELDAQTLAAIEDADAQIDRGECMPLDDAFAQLRRKHFDR